MSDVNLSRAKVSYWWTLILGLGRDILAPQGYSCFPKGTRNCGGETVARSTSPKDVRPESIKRTPCRV